jgi:hypothetical protein
LIQPQHADAERFHRLFTDTVVCLVLFFGVHCGITS